MYFELHLNVQHPKSTHLICYFNSKDFQEQQSEWWTFGCQIYIRLQTLFHFLSLFTLVTWDFSFTVFFLPFNWACFTAKTKDRLNAIRSESIYFIFREMFFRLARHGNLHGLMLWTVNNPNTLIVMFLSSSRLSSDKYRTSREWKFLVNNNNRRCQAPEKVSFLYFMKFLVILIFFFFNHVSLFCFSYFQLFPSTACGALLLWVSR